MERKLQITEAYIYLPIQTGRERRQLDIFLEEKGERKIFEFQIPVGETDGGRYPFDYEARFPVKQFIGKTILLRGDMPEQFFTCVRNDACNAAEKNYAVEELRRPSIHFTAETGWINDPNGLVYRDGFYHLYFQQNPFDVQWENMCWGHAVSKDLMHWEQKDTVLFPDAWGSVFSGSGIVNERRMLGLPEEAFLFFYTAAGSQSEWSAGREFVQRMAYSTDGGNTLIKVEQGGLDTVCRENRDPKVFYHAQSSAYIMVLWLEKNDFGIFRSTNLTGWEMSDRLTLEDAWECPDLVELLDDAGERQWVFLTADGYYFFGEFDGWHFRTDGIRHQAYMNRIPYAAQTYSGVADRTILIPWLRIPNRGRLYTGVMGIPRELGIVTLGGEKRLTLRPVREYEERRKALATPEGQKQTCKQDGTDCELIYYSTERKAIELEVQIEDETKEVAFWINDTRIAYEVRTGSFSVNGEQYEILPGIAEFSFLIDDVVFEVTAGYGTIMGVFELQKPDVEIWKKTDCPVRVKLYETD